MAATSQGAKGYARLRKDDVDRRSPVLMGTRSVQRRLAEGGEQRQAGHQPGDLITD